MSTLAEKWIEQGIQKGIQQGIEQELKNSIVELLQIRFDGVPNEMVKHIQKMKDPEVLQAIRRQAVVEESLAEFGRFLTTLPLSSTSS